jgi:hypothetical protein
MQFGGPVLQCAHMAAAMTPELPGLSWTEDSHLTVPKSERKLRRWGSVAQACKMLDECDRETLYDLSFMERRFREDSPLMSGKAS